MEKKVTKIFTILLAIMMAFTCLNYIVPAEEAIENETVEETQAVPEQEEQEENEEEQEEMITEVPVNQESTSTDIQDNNEIQPRDTVNGMNKSDWSILSETEGEIELKSYKGPAATEVIVPGEIDGKQVYISGSIESTHNSLSSNRTSLGRPSEVTSVIFQEVNGKKVKVKNHYLTKLFYKYDTPYSLLKSVDVRGLDISGVTDMYFMFKDCMSLTTLIGMEAWDTSAMKDMYGIFEGCSSLTDLTPITNWNVSSVTDMEGMFSGCSSLMDLTPIANWKFPAVRHMSRMFSGCSSLTNLTPITNWSFPVVTHMSRMFSGCSSLIDLTPITNWKFPAVRYITYLFSGCSSLTDLAPITNWKFPKVTDISGMFFDCKNLTDLTPLKNWDVSSIQNLGWLFQNCISIHDLTALSNWNTSKTTSMQNMFQGCTGLTDITPILNWDVSSVQHMAHMFYNCSNLIYIDLSNWDVNESCAIANMFRVTKKSVPLLIISSNEKFKDYNYKGSNRTPVGPIFDAGDGIFSNGSTKKKGTATNILDNTTTAVDTFIQQAVEMVEEPLKVDHTLLNWQNSLDDSATVYEKMNQTYHATWKIEPWLTVTFDSDGGSSILDQKVKEGKTTVPPEVAPIKTGYVFDNWYENKEVTAPFDFNTPITNNQTLVAKYKEFPYQISYVMNGGVNDANNKTEYTITSRTIDIYQPTRQGYTFTGWTYVNGNDIIMTPIEKLSIKTGSIGDWVLFANWEQEIEHYTITFDSQEGSIIESQTVEEGQTIVEPSQPDKEGYRFDGWYTDMEYTNVYDFHAPVTNNKTLYAKWEENQYTIHYELDGGKNNEANPSNYTIISSTIEIQQPSKAGYEFAGWTYKHKDITTSDPSLELYIPTGSIEDWTLKANWTEVCKTYHVIFNSDGGNYVESQMVEKGKKAIEPNIPNKRGYRFENWYEEGKDTPFDFTVPIISDKKLVAKYQEEEYNLIYVLDGGVNDKNNSTTYKISTSNIDIFAPRKEGYKFIGWTYVHGSDASLTLHPTLNIPTGSTGDWVLIANYETISNYYTITFDTNGGSKIASQKVKETKTAIPPVNPIKKGYLFENWYESGSTDPYNFDTLIQEDKTLYARYKEEEYHIVYVLNGGMNADNPVSYTITTPTIPIKEPSREGYEFTGWSYVHGTEIVTKLNGTTLSIPSGSTGDWVLIANWKKEGAVGLMLYNSEIQLMNNGTVRDDWNIASETDSEIVLKSYKGTSKDIIVPGEIDGKQVYITGVPSDINYVREFDNYRTVFPDSMTSIKFQTVNKRKVMIKGDSLKHLFYYYQRLVSFDGSGLDTTGVIDMNAMFSRCEGLKKLTGLEDWNTSSVIDMSWMFFRCKLTKLTGLEKWDVSAVTRMAAMFSDCDFLNNIDSLKNWDISKVTDMQIMFNNCMCLSDLTPLKDWDVSSLISMRLMFSGCMSLSDLTPLKNWNVKSLRSTNEAFSYCECLSEVTGLENWNTSEMMEMEGIFSKNPDLWFVDLSNWKLDKVNADFKIRNMFKVNVAGYEDYGLQPLLVIGNDKRLINYDYASDDRIPVGPTFDAYGGNFMDGSTSKQACTTYVLENTTIAVDRFIENALEIIETPTREGYKFVEWKVNLDEDASTYQRMSAIYQAKWVEKEKLIVNFDSLGGNKVAHQILDSKEQASKPNNPVKEHYIFTGWYLDKEGTLEYDFNTPVTDDLTLYAGWKEMNYQINYVGMDDTSKPTSYTFESPELRIEQPNKEGYTFTGWTYVHGRDINLTPSMEVVIPSGSTGDWVLFASWKENNAIKVKFDSAGGSKVEDQSLLSGMKAERPSNPVKKGYTFDNWYDDNSYTTEHDFDASMNGDTTLYAKWNIISYPIEYELDGGVNDPSNRNSYTLEDGSIQIKEPTKEGYTFIGWTYEHGDIQTTRPSKELYVPAGSQEKWNLIAHYEKIINTYIIVFDSAGGSEVKNQVVEEGKKVIAPISPIKNGYTFVGWYESEAAMDPYDFSRAVTSDKQLIARYQEIPYRITYMEEELSRSINNPTTYTISSPEFTIEEQSKQGYEFIGWIYVHGTNVSTTPSKTVTIKTGSTGDLVLIPRWNKIIEEYTVSFDSSGGSKVESQTIEKDSLAVKPVSPQKRGYTFENWYEGTVSTPFDFSTPITSDKELIGKYQEVPYRITNIVENSYTQTSYTINSPTYTMEEPSKAGYRFEGWTYVHDTEVNLTPSKDFSIPAGSTGDWVIFENWKENETCIVSFDSDGGSEVESQSILSGLIATRPEDPTREGYTFDNWYEEDKITPFDFTTVITSDNVLKARWNTIPYAITYDLDGGENHKDNPSSYTIESKDITIKEPTKPGYIFVGWMYEHEEITTSSPEQNITIVTGSGGDWKFIANWKKQEVKVDTSDPIKILPDIMMLFVSIMGMVTLKKRNKKSV